MVEAKGVKWGWLVCGDFNKENKDSVFADMAEYHGGRDVGGMEEEGTRWASTRRIDWMMSNKTQRVSNMEVVQVKVSDHKMLKVEVEVDQGTVDEMGILEGKPEWGKPAGMEAAIWKGILNDKWDEMVGEEHQSIKEWDLAIEHKEAVEDIWRKFNTAMGEMHRRAFLEAASQLRDVDEEEARRMELRATRKGDKGARQRLNRCV